MIPLVKKRTTIDNTTFSPVVEVVLMLPVVQLRDMSASDSGFYEKIGRKLCELLVGKTE